MEGFWTVTPARWTPRRRAGKKDSEQHSRERQQEGAEINTSLHALKECIRAQGKPWAPYARGEARTGTADPVAPP